jgi:hypothetical protein
LASPPSQTNKDQDSKEKTQAEILDDEALKEVRRAYMTAILRGFLAYALVVGGYLVVIPETSLASTTPGQYIRLAGLITAISFLVGFEPNSLGRLFKLVFSPDDAEKNRAHAESMRTELADLRATLAARTDNRTDKASAVVPTAAAESPESKG